MEMASRSAPHTGGANELRCQIKLGSGQEHAQAVVVDGGVRVTLEGDATGKDMTTALLGPAPVEGSCLATITCGVCGARPTPKSPEKDVLLSFKDLLGATLNRETKVLRLVNCPKPGGGARVRLDVLLQVESDALDNAEAWALKVSQHCVSRRGRTRYLVLVNPCSGSGLGKGIWEAVKELWNRCPWIQFEEVITTRAGEGGEKVRDMVLEDFDGVVIVSGDGLVYEVYNGMMARADKNKAFPMPIGHIPAGSGNGLATSILKSCDESYGVLDAAFLIAKGGQQPLDLFEVRQPDRADGMSFLSLSAGVIADIDLESESLRCLGGARFEVYGLYAAMCPRSLPAELVYWPADSPIALPASPPAIGEPLTGGAWQKIEDDLTFFWAMNTAWAASNSLPAPSQGMGDGAMSLVVMRRASRCTLVKTLLGLETGDHISIDGVEVLRVRAFRLTPRTTKAHFAVDGEEVPLTPVQYWPAAVQGNVLGAPFVECTV